MPKYRLLRPEELENLENEFVNYLVVNGITAEDWEKLKNEQPEEAQRITDLFSDVVFESVLRKAKYLEFRGKDYWQLVHCGEKQMQMIAFRDKTGQHDFREDAPVQKVLNQQLAPFEVFRGTKDYKKEREQEIFALTEKGYRITDGTHYESLSIKLA